MIKMNEKDIEDYKKEIEHVKKMDKFINLFNEGENHEVNNYFDGKDFLFLENDIKSFCKLTFDEIVNNQLIDKFIENYEYYFNGSNC